MQRRKPYLLEAYGTGLLIGSPILRTGDYIEVLRVLALSIIKHSRLSRGRIHGTSY
jgi:hypothetical protein